MRNWRDILPAKVADEQTAYDRLQAIGRMRSVGMTYEEIGRRICKHRARAKQLFTIWERVRQRPAPIERYLSERTELREVHFEFPCRPLPKLAPSK